MPSARVEIRPAFSFVEALNHAEDEREVFSRERVNAVIGRAPLNSETKNAHRIASLLSTIAHAMWVPKVMSGAKFDALQVELESRPLTLVRDLFARDPEQLYSARTAAARSDVRDRVMNNWCFAGDDARLTDMALFVEVCREGIVDWAVNSTRPNYEVRRCPWCGRWFEPQLSGRSRFCSGPRCRQEFNNARQSAQESVRSFDCDVCTGRVPLEEYAGLHRTEDPWEIESRIDTPLYIGRVREAEAVCVRCVRAHYPEWAKYVSTIVDRREAVR